VLVRIVLEINAMHHFFFSTFVMYKRVKITILKLMYKHIYFVVYMPIYPSVSVCMLFVAKGWIQ